MAIQDVGRKRANLGFLALGGRASLTFLISCLPDQVGRFLDPVEQTGSRWLRAVTDLQRLFQTWAA